MTTSPDPGKNHLLAALPAAELQRWLPDLEYIEMHLGQVLYEAGSTLSHVYFPTTAIVSLHYVMPSGKSTEIAVVGSEGVVGVSLFMGGDSASSRAQVQSAGGACRGPVSLTTPRAGLECSTARGWRNALANAMQGSKGNTTDCCRLAAQCTVSGLA